MDKSGSIIGIVKGLDTMIGKKAFDFAKNIGGEKFCPSPLQFEIYKYLFEHKGESVTQSDLEKHLGISKTAVSGAVISMEKQGAIERKQSPKDKRANNIKITEKSEVMFEKMKILHSQTDELLIDGVSKNDLETFYKVVEKMVENIKRSMGC